MGVFAADLDPVIANRDPDSSPPVVVPQIISALWALPIVPLSLLLLAVARTWDGRLFTVAALFTGLLPLLGSIAWVTKRRLWRRLAAGAGLGWLVAISVVLWRAPDGTGSAQSRIVHAYANGQTKFQRYALGNLLPEVDQLRLGFTLMPAFDSRLTSAQASDLKRMTATIYAELERDPEFHRLGSVMPEVYDEILGLPFDRGHCYVYVPSRVDRTRPSPVLVFFHGYGGCFKAYLWILSKVADRLGCIVVAPSHGLGEWRAEVSEGSLRSALESASRIAAIDRDRIHLAGLSNGGLAISQLAAAEGTRFRSLIYLSPVFDAEQVSRTTFVENCRGRPVLVLTGKEDDRVPLSYVMENVAALTRTGVDVRLKTVAGADHFLVFSHRDLVIDTLASWLRENGAAL